MLRRLQVMPIRDCGDGSSASRFCTMLEQLRLFMTVVEEGSLRRAAHTFRNLL
jgi:hypothetical protein